MQNSEQSSILVLFLLMLACAIQYGCASSGGATTSTPTETDIPYVSMLDRLRKVPNLMITGTQDNPIILIRGNRSMEGENEPLFEVDGTIVGNGYDSIRSVDVNEVESIRVLPPSQAGLYGSRGGNGVIKIQTKH